MADETEHPTASSKEGQHTGLLSKLKGCLSSLISRDDTEQLPPSPPQKQSVSLQVAHPVTETKRSEAKTLARKPAMGTPAFPLDTQEVQPSAHDRTKMYQLYNKYRHLLEERNEVNSQKEELTRKVDSGELTTAQAHQKIVALTREASQLTEVIRELSERLAELGHPHFK